MGFLEALSWRPCYNATRLAAFVRLLTTKIFIQVRDTLDNIQMQVDLG